MALLPSLIIQVSSLNQRWTNVVYRGVKSVDMTGSYMFYSTYKVNSLKFKMNIYKPL